jgi:hypothetical protein
MATRADVKKYSLAELKDEISKYNDKTTKSKMTGYSRLKKDALVDFVMSRAEDFKYLNKTGGGKSQPKKAEPKKAEPKKAEPKKAEPKKAEPKQPKGKCPAGCIPDPKLAGQKIIDSSKGKDYSFKRKAIKYSALTKAIHKIYSGEHAGEEGDEEGFAYAKTADGKSKDPKKRYERNTENTEADIYQVQLKFLRELRKDVGRLKALQKEFVKENGRESGKIKSLLEQLTKEKKEVERRTDGDPPPDIDDYPIGLAVGATEKKSKPKPKKPKKPKRQTTDEVMAEADELFSKLNIGWNV